MPDEPRQIFRPRSSVALPMGPCFEPLEPRILMSGNVFPDSPGLALQTGGQQVTAASGDWYSSDSTGSTDRAHYHAVQVTQLMLDASPDGIVTITVGDAELSPDGSEPNLNDEVVGAADPSRFRLLNSDRATVLDTAVVASGTANGHSVSFSVTSAGDYFVEAVTGAQAAYAAGEAGHSTAEDLNNDYNSYTLSVSERGGLLGSYQTSYVQETTSTRNLYFIVPAGTTSLYLRNYELNSEASAVRYHDPTGAVRAGTESGDAVWNGTSDSGIPGTADSGGDVFTGLGDAEAGVWRIEFADLPSFNRFIFEANTGTGPGDAQRLVVYEEAPGPNDDAYGLEEDTPLVVIAAAGLLANDPAGGGLASRSAVVVTGFSNWDALPRDRRLFHLHARDGLRRHRFLQLPHQNRRPGRRTGHRRADRGIQTRGTRPDQLLDPGRGIPRHSRRRGIDHQRWHLQRGGCRRAGCHPREHRHGRRV